MTHVDIEDAHGSAQPIAVDTISAEDHQLVKVEFGAAGSATQVSSANPLPVDASGHTIPVTTIDGGSVAIGATTDLEASGNGTLIGVVKRLRTLLNGGLPAALGPNGGMKVETVGDLALDRTTDTAAVALQSDAIATGSLAGSNLTILTPKFAKISTSTTGSTTVVAAVTSKKIRVLRWDLVVASAINIKWQSHVTPTDLTGLYCFPANGGISAPFCPLGHFETVAGEALDINLSSGSIAVGGSLVYVEV